MRRKTRYRLLALKEAIVQILPVVVIGGAAAALIWAILTWPERHKFQPSSDEPPPSQETVSGSPES